MSNKISDSEIENFIKTMNPNKSVHSDVSCIPFEKLNTKIISPYLSKLFNKYVEYAVFPELLKFAEVFKFINPVKKNINIYQPILFIPIFKKY